ARRQRRVAAEGGEILARRPRRAAVRRDVDASRACARRAREDDPRVVRIDQDLGVEAAGRRLKERPPARAAVLAHEDGALRFLVDRTGRVDGGPGTGSRFDRVDLVERRTEGLPAGALREESIGQEDAHRDETEDAAAVHLAALYGLPRATLCPVDRL